MRTRSFVALLVVLGLAPLLGARPAAAQPPTCLGEPATIVADGPGGLFGTGGRDVVVANELNAQSIFTYGGDDLVCAGAGDVVLAGSGNDTVAAASASFIYGESGHDVIDARPGQTVVGGSGDDFLRCEGCVHLVGDAGSDVLEALANVVVCDGGSGTDSLTAIGQNCGTIKSIP
jgi:hypothetical protein